MEAKRISRRAVKDMIDGNTALLHIGNFDTLQRLTNTLSTTLILTIQASITHWL